MKINEITLEYYGKYKETTLNFGEGLNVVYGQNEAGKSTLFSALMALLFGFKPANKESHPYLGWQANQLAIKGRLEDNMGPLQVERKLSSGPIGRVYREDSEMKINNRPLEQVGHLSKQTFESIYALALKDVVKMSAAPWSEVEDKLIMNYGVEAFFSPREVVRSIEEDMRQLYNPRGQAKNTETKQLELAIKKLMDEKRHVLERQREVLEIEESLHYAEEELKAKEQLVLSLTNTVQWWERHGRLVELIQQADLLSQKIDALSEVMGKVPDSVSEYSALSNALKELAEESQRIRANKEAVDAEILVLTDEEQDAMNQMVQLKTLLGIAKDNEQNIRLYAQEESFVIDKRAQLERHLSDLLKHPTDDQIIQLSELNLISLEAKFDKITQLKNDTDNLQRELFALQLEKTSSDKLLGMLGMVCGGLIFGVGTYLAQPMVNYLAVLLLSFGLFKFLHKKGVSVEEDKRVYQQKCQFNEQRINEKVNEINSQLKLVSLDKERIIENGRRIYQVLYEGKELAADLLKTAQTWARNKEKAQLTANRLQENLATIFGKDVSFEEVSLWMETAKSKQTQNIAHLKESDQMFKQLEAMLQKEKLLKEKIDTAEAFLLALGTGDINNGLKVLEDLKNLRNRHRFIVSEMDQQDPSGLMRAEIKQRSKLSEDLGLLTQRKIELKTLKESIEEIKIRRQKHKTDLEHLLPKTDLFEVESQLMALQERLEQAKIAYDQLQILKAVVEGFDQSYRETHQPDILKKTGLYFKQLTKGKYPRIYNDESLGKTTLLIRQNGEDHIVEEGLSQGARDQLYLSLRLALAEELDGEKERLPLFLDEVFVNWDMDRLDEGLNLLKKLSNERQIILFTCHEWLVNRIKENTSTHLVVLNK